MKKLFFITSLLVFTSIAFYEISSGAKIKSNISDEIFCVRQGGSGNRTGNDWSNAMSSLPGKLVRGGVYYIASGDYPKRDFTDSIKGNNYIEIKAATESDHGPETGWSKNYEGKVIFGPLVFNSPYYKMDGGEKKLIEIKSEFTGAVVSIKGERIELQNILINGGFEKGSGNKHIKGACNGINITGSDITVTGCKIYDLADDGVEIHSVKRLKFTGNTIRNLHGCGTDGGCGPCNNGHSDGIEIYDAIDSEISGNFISDIKGNAALFFGNWGTLCKNLKIFNNIFYSPDTGFAVYIIDCDKVQFFNNIVWGTDKGGYGGLAIGKRVTKLEMYNNIILSINYKHLGASYNPAEHRGGNNLFGRSLGQYKEKKSDLVSGEPMFKRIPGISGKSVENPIPEDFILKSGSPGIDKGFAGDKKITIPLYDFKGKKRIVKPDIGAFEL